METNVKKFIELYNKLDEILSKKYAFNGSGISYIYKYSNELINSNNYKTTQRGKYLNEVRELRNALVHDFDMNKDNLISINDNVIYFLEKEISYLTNPLKAIDIATSIDKLIYAKLESDVSSIIDTMLNKGFLQFPVLDNYFHLIGVLSPNTFILYASKHKRQNFEEKKVNDLIEFLPIDKHISEYYAFMGKNEPIEKVTKLYDEYIANGKRLAMIFLTDEGKANQPLKGVITPYDILK